MWKYVLSAFAIGFAWAAVKILHLPQWYGIVFTLLQALISAIIFLVKFFRARNSAKKLERALGAQADEHAKMARPEHKAEVVALKGEFLKAVGALKASRLGKGGMSALYALPWYMIIGPPGAGKSTALRNSGLQFPYLSATGGAVRGIGGTRNCDWWLTNEAILLDTAGRYTSDDDDKDEWHSFLDLIRHSRPKKPVNGIFVAVSIAEIAGASDEELQTLSHRLRERIDEVVERLQLVAPVYLLMTKCDLIDGFSEIFGDLKKQDRGQIWGFTLPLEKKDPRPIIDIVGGRFDELLDNVKKRATRRLGVERRIESREKIFGFPQQFALLRPQLGQFLSTLFASNVYKETPMIRGVYFTSGTQEGRPIDRVMTAMAEAFGVAPQLPAQEPVVEQKSYFLRDVFHNVVFPDKNLAARTKQSANRLRNRNYAIGAAAMGVALLVSLFPAVSYVKNRELIGSTADVVAQVAKRRAAPTKDGRAAAPIPLEKLEPLRQRVDLLRQYHVDSAPTELRFGLYRGDELYPHVSQLYADVLRTDIIAPIAWNIAEELTPFARDPDNTGYDAALYDKLKLYLVLTGPREPAQPAPTGALLDWTVERVVEQWASMLGTDEIPEAKLEAMKQHARLYMQLAAADPNLALTRDAELVKRVRIGLAKIPIEKVILDPLIAEMSAEGYDLDLKKILGGASTGPIESRGKVRGAFTRAAWEQKVRPRLAAASSGAAPWVLGPENNRQGSTAEQVKQLKSKYFDLYIQEWQTFLSGIRVKSVTAELEVLAMLQDLTRGTPGPIGKLMLSVAKNVHLEEEQKPGAGLAEKGAAMAGEQVAKKGGKAGKAAAGALNDAMAGAPREEGIRVASDVEAVFVGFFSFGVPPPPPPGSDVSAPPASTSLDVYQEQLAFMRDAFNALIENPGESGPAIAKVAAANTVVSGLIQAQEIGWRPRFLAILEPPVKSTGTAIDIKIGKGKGLPFCNEVVNPFDNGLKGKYPFNPNGHDAALADIADFYKPDGTLWAHFDKNLAGQVQRMGDHFEFNNQLGGGSTLSGSLLSFLTRSWEITSVLFPPGAKDPTVEFEVQIKPVPGVSSISFTVDGQTFKTQMEPDRWFKVKWPGEGKHGATINVKGPQQLSETLSQEGDWGLFRLLEQGKAEASMSSRVFQVTWQLSSRSNIAITFLIRPARNESPFFGTSRKGAKLMAPFRRSDVNPPHSLTSGGGCHTNR